MERAARTWQTGRRGGHVVYPSLSSRGTTVPPEFAPFPAALRVGCQASSGRFPSATLDESERCLILLLGRLYLTDETPVKGDPLPRPLPDAGRGGVTSVAIGQDGRPGPPRAGEGGRRPGGVRRGQRAPESAGRPDCRQRSSRDLPRVLPLVLFFLVSLETLFYTRFNG